MPNKTQPIIIGLIYAKWCGHCKILKPIWNKMKKNIHHKVKKGIYKKPYFLTIEQSNMQKLDKFNRENSQYLNHQEVKYDGFPTIFRVKGGNIEYYKDSREANLMENWFMNEKSVPPTNNWLFSGGRKTKKNLRFSNRRKTAKR